MSRKIRVAQILETIHLGGVEQRVRTIVRGLDPSRYEHLVICTQALGAIPDQLREAGARIVEVGPFRRRLDPIAIGRAYRALHSFAPDIVHGGVFEGVIMGVVGGRLARVPVVISEETSDPVGRRVTGHQLAKMLYRASDCTIAVSPFIERYLSNGLNLPRSKVRMIANSVSAPAPGSTSAGAALREELAIPASSLVFGTLGRLLDKHKGVSDAIRAFAKLDFEERADLLVVGIGPDEETLRTLAQELGVGERIHFAGYRCNPYVPLDAMDIFVHPARYEAFGMVIAEAMLAGLPVIATRVGGIPDVVEESETALLVDPGDAEALASAMVRLARDTKLRERLGEAGKQRALELFGEQRYLKEIEALYSNLLPRSRRR